MTRYKAKLDEILATKPTYLRLDRYDGFLDMTKEETDTLVDFLLKFTPKKIVFADIVFVFIGTDDKNPRNDKKILEASLRSPSIEFIKCCGFSNLDGDELFKIVFTQANVVDLRFTKCGIAIDQIDMMSGFLRSNNKLVNIKFSEKVKTYLPVLETQSKNIVVHGTLKHYLIRNRSYEACCLAALQLILIHRHRQSILNIIDKNIIVMIAKLVYETRTSYDWVMRECTNMVHDFSL